MSPSRGAPSDPQAVSAGETPDRGWAGLLEPQATSVRLARGTRRLDWVAIATIGALFVAAIPGTGALFFSDSSLRATNAQIQIAEQGQITDRYNAAITNLGSGNIEVRLGGIYALQRLMQDSPRDQPTVVAVLCAFVRDQAGPAAMATEPPTRNPPTDIQAAVTVVGTRDTAHDGRTTVVDFIDAQLAGVNLTGGHLADANLAGTNLTGAYLPGANLAGASLVGANLTGANLAGANVSHAVLENANLTNATLDNANLTHAFIFAANLTGASFYRASLPRADLDGANLTGAYLSNANLAGASLVGADLTGADLTDANLTDALVTSDFKGVNLKGALWSKGIATPKGWTRAADSGRLTPTNAHS
jgi:uncharacterized protein YjbI with pentapeptide repeats